MGFDEHRLSEELHRRYLDIRSPRMKSILIIQDEALSALRDFLKGKGFVEILAPIIGPVTDPGIRGAKQVTIDYYGHSFKVMSSMILYKQMAVCSLEKIYALSPNVRLEPLESLKTGRHLSEFRQLDLEVARATYHEVMSLAERMLRYICTRTRERCREELKFLGRDLRVPRLPFKRLSYHEGIDLLRREGFDLDYEMEIPWDAEEHLSGMFEDPFFIYDYPETARGFYDREDPNRKGILRDFDLLYPEGFGEAISGGEREYEYEKVLRRVRRNGEDPEAYGWYLEMLREGIVPSAGFGIGVERLTRYLCGVSKIWEAVPFPKVPGIASP
ncbi:MAG: asparagine synthetase A [Candidatus Bathyarchaeia archaeon]